MAYGRPPVGNGHAAAGLSAVLTAGAAVVMPGIAAFFAAAFLAGSFLADDFFAESFFACDFYYDYYEN